MLSPSQVTASTKAILDYYQEVELEVLEMLGRKLAEGDLSRTDEYLAKQFASNTGRDISGIIATKDTKALAIIEKSSRDTMLKGLAGEATYSGIAISSVFRSRLNSQATVIARRFVSTTPNFVTGTLTSYNKAVNKAVTAVASGYRTPQKALELATRTLAQQGMQTVDFNGSRLNIEDSIKRTIRTEINQAYSETQMDWITDAGIDLVETSAHAGARPEHAEWQGQVFSLTGSGGYENFYEVTGYGEVDGLAGVNCRHTFGSYDEEFGQRYDVDPNAGMDNDEVYALSQQQRYQERKIRELKREIAARKGAGLDTKDLSQKVSERRAKLVGISEQASLRNKTERTSVIL